MMKKLEIYKFLTVKCYWKYVIILYLFNGKKGNSPPPSKPGNFTPKSPPFENEGYTVWMDYKQKIPKFARNHRGNGFYEVLLLLLHTNHPLGKRGLCSLNGLQAKNSKIWTKPLRQWVLWGPSSIVIHKSPPWKMGATQFDLITSKQTEVCTKPLSQWVSWCPSSIMSTQSIIISLDQCPKLTAIQQH